MARIRTIKPEFWTSKTLARLSRDSRLTFIGLWNLADDLGILLDLPRKIAADLFPHEDVTLQQINEWIDELESVGLVVRASEKSKDFIIIRSWDEHQKIDRPSKSTLLSRESRDTLATHSMPEREREREREREKEREKEKEKEKEQEGGCKGETHEAIDESADVQGNEDESSGRGKRDPDFPQEFEDFWNQHPRRHGSDSKHRASRAWSARIRDGTAPGLMIAGAMRYAAFCDAKRITGTEYVMQAATFLGPDRHFENDWKKPNGTQHVLDPNDRPF